MTGIWSLFRFVLLFSPLWIGPCFQASAASGEAGQPVSGDVRSPLAFYGVVFYCAKGGTASSKAELKKLVDEMLPGTAFDVDAGKNPKPPFLVFEEEQAPLKDFSVPEPSYFKHAGRGLSDGDVQSLQKTPRATHVMLVMPSADTWKSGRIFAELVLKYAESQGAYIWDSATRECFSREAWKKSRLDSWPADTVIPDLSHQVTIHLYRPEESSPYLRAITLGMEKFALPDVVIEQLTASDNRPAGNLINLACQHLAEKPGVADGKDCLLDVSQIENKAVRDKFKESFLQGAAGKVRLALLKGKPQDGDPDNDLIELDFRNQEGASADEKRNKALSGLWGSSDSIIRVEHDDEIRAASKRARDRLPELRKQLQDGLKTGERILLKAPFPRDDGGREWMWVEIMEWKEAGQAAGLLQNDPFYIKKLKAGTSVTIQISDVFDYIFYRADGTNEGNETGRLMQKQQGEVKKK